MFGVGTIGMIGQPVQRRPESPPDYPPYVQEYLDRVTAADVAAGNIQGLERSVTDAISTCLQALVADGILGVSGGVLSASASLIKAACFMQGARTLSGSLVPLAADMPAPTNFNFVAGDYNRRLGLVGDGITKCLDTNRANNADAQNSKHLCVYATSVSNSIQAFAGARTPVVDSTGQISVTAAANSPSAGRCNTETAQNGASLPIAGATLFGVSRQSSTAFTYRVAGINNISTAVSQTPTAVSIGIFARKTGTSFDTFSSSRLAFYSSGQWLDLAVLEARIAALSAAIQAAIAP